MMKVFGDIEGQMSLTNDREAARDFSLDTKLGWLAGHVGSVATTTRRHDALLRVAAVMFAWLESMHVKPLDILLKIADERVRQRELFKARKHSFRVDSPVVDTWRKLRVLVEELGEVAEAIDDLEKHPQHKQRRNHLITELVQVAAVTVAWLESMEVKP
jgi:hypothetical protein